MKRSALLLTAFLVIFTCFGQRKQYPGDHHTTSHGGTYVGGSGSSSHKGGHYKNSNTGNHYGRHKK